MRGVGLQKGRGQVGSSREPGPSSLIPRSLSPRKEENTGLWFSMRHDVGRRQNFPIASSGRPLQQPSVGARRPFVVAGAGPSWRLPALPIPWPLTKGRERSCGPARLWGMRGCCCKCTAGTNYLNICFPHGY